MKLELRILILALLLSPSLLFADAFLMPGTVAKSELVKPFPQPYVVKKGDTLWDIAEEYFADPEKWIKIWEQNLYVSNPDLIYPGNEVWLRMKEVKKKVQPKPEVVTLEPRIIYKPAQRIEKEIDTKIFLTALARQDFIRPDAVEGVGHILDSEDERLNYGALDRVYLTLDVKANPGDIFDIYRTGDPVYNKTEDGKKMAGYLVKHLGRVEVTSVESGVYRGIVLEAFEEIGRTDRLKKTHEIDYNIEPTYPEGPLLGHVMYIRDDAAEAGQGQVLGIDLGLKDGLEPGAILGLYRQGRLIRDKTYEEETFQALPEEKIGEIIVLVPQDNASIVLVMRSSAPINTGDMVQALRHK
ncbi:MAG: LysM peptidoglycan-binding domain-containing protein [Ghiorsea sp.]|nr:LysM peptidoglycan-binding domain-containing protein [Ghiorsea sp.]